MKLLQNGLVTHERKKGAVVAASSGPLKPGIPMEMTVRWNPGEHTLIIEMISVNMASDQNIRISVFRGIDLVAPLRSSASNTSENNIGSSWDVHVGVLALNSTDSTLSKSDPKSSTTITNAAFPADYSLMALHLSPVVPDIAATRVYYFERYAGYAGQLGMFALALVDGCGGRLLRAPAELGPLAVRLRMKIEARVSWEDVHWGRLQSSPAHFPSSCDHAIERDDPTANNNGNNCGGMSCPSTVIQAMVSSNPGPPPNFSPYPMTGLAREPRSPLAWNQRSPLHHYARVHPVLVTCAVRYVPVAGMYVVSYVPALPGRYYIELAFDDRFGTYNSSTSVPGSQRPTDDTLLRWRPISLHEIYVPHSY